jgi:hypothetical protein
VAVAPLVALAGCSDGGDSTSSTTSATRVATSTTEPRSSTTRPRGTIGSTGDCPDADAVAEVVGGPVDRNPNGGSSFSSGSDGKSVSYSYSGCDYEVTEGPDGEVTIAHITESQLDGKPGPTGSALFDALATAAEADAVDDGFVSLEGIGREAYRDGDRIVARTATGLLVVSVEGADREPDLDATEALARAMARTSPALTADGTSNGEACADLHDAVGRAIGAGVTDDSQSSGSSGVGDASLDWSGCSFDLSGGGEATVGVGAADEWDAWVAAKRESPFSVSYEEVTVGELTAFDDGEKLVVDTGADPLLVETSGDDLGPDQATLRVDLAELALGG